MKELLSLLDECADHVALDWCEEHGHPLHDWLAWLVREGRGPYLHLWPSLGPRQCYWHWDLHSRLWTGAPHAVPRDLWVALQGFAVRAYFSKCYARRGDALHDLAGAMGNKPPVPVRLWDRVRNFFRIRDGWELE